MMSVPVDPRPAPGTTRPAEAVPAEDGAQPGKQHARKAVVVHGGARDSYQRALALQQAGLLEVLVTDLYWPADRGWAQAVAKRLSPAWRELVLRRNVAGLPGMAVNQRLFGGLRALVLDRLPRIPFALRRQSIRAGDAALGRAAGRRARNCNAGLVSYSYYGYDAIAAYGQPAMLFQVHPHPGTVRRLLRQELADHPECASSLEQEWELALPEEDFERLSEEPRMASHLLAASSFTRDSLIEHGAPPESISVVPYGVDLERFHPAPGRLRVDKAPLRLLFVGRINQRKGIKYLLQALAQFTPEEVQLTVCGRVVDGLELFAGLGAQVEVRASVSESELVQAYQAADLFVFPSVAEGFGQVLLESLACGLPILSTTHTAAPDLIEDGVQGFIVPPRRPDLLAGRIRWAFENREELARMGERARRRAEYFTWPRFRQGAATAVDAYLASL
jgi:glycosyltransferase involved in cell wall biosynthesis